MEPAEPSAIDAAKKGSADILILALVDEEPLHGYEIGGRIEARSAGTLVFTLASLYATLYRLEARGLREQRAHAWILDPKRRRLFQHGRFNRTSGRALSMWGSGLTFRHSRRYDRGPWASSTGRWR
jgi:hypothetical protein